MQGIAGLSATTTPTVRLRWPLVLIFSLVGFLLNLLPIPLTSFMSLVCGSLMTLLLVPRASLAQVLVASLITSLSLWWSQDSLWMMLTFGLEALTLWLLCRRGIPLLLVDLLYWVAIGMPLTAFILWSALHVPIEYQLHITLKQGANGVAVAAVTSLLLALPLLARHLAQPRLSRLGFRERLTQLVFSALMASMLIGGVVVETISLRDEREVLLNDMREVALGLGQRFEERVERILMLLAGVGRLTQDPAGPDDLSQYMSALTHSFSELAAVSLYSADGRLLLTSPPLANHRLKMRLRQMLDEDADFAATLAKGKSHVSGIQPRPSPFAPIQVILSAPTMANEQITGVIQATLNVPLVARMLDEHQKVRAILVDQQRHILAASSALAMNHGEQLLVHPLGDRANLFFLPSARLGRNSEIYLYQQQALPYGWQLYLVRSYGAELDSMYERYQAIGLFALLLVPFGWLLARTFARSVALPLEQLILQVRRLGVESSSLTPTLSTAPREISDLASAVIGRHQEIQRLQRDMQLNLDERTREIVEARNLLTRVLNTIPARVYWKDTNSRYLGGNHWFARDAGLRSPHELVGMLDAQLPWNGHAGRYVAEDQQVMSSGQPLIGMVELQQLGERSRWLEVSKVPLTSASGQCIGVLGVYQEISERIAREQELVEAKTAAESATRAKSAFLANMSHEIRTPLNAIVGLVDLVLSSSLAHLQRERLLSVQRASDHLLTVISDILDYSKIEAGHLQLQLAPFALNQLLDDLEGIFLPSAEAKGLRLSIVRAPGNPCLLGDVTRLRQVLANLLSNAIKFTERGEVSLTASISTEIRGYRLNCVVRDSGIGMNQIQRQRLFQPFSQVDDSLTRSRGGTGLGLSISRQLMELMGGDLECDSTPGLGSSFRLQVVLTAATLPELPPAPIPEQRLDGIQVLLVEDNLINQEVAKGMLERAGAEVQVAGHGGEAISWLRQHQADLVLMDLQMPVMDGYETTIRIRDELQLSVPIVALTANAQSDEYARAERVGMNGYLTKPVRPAELVRTIAGFCRGQRPRQKPQPASTPSPEQEPFAELTALEQCGGDQQLLQRLLERFAQEWGNRPATLRALAANSEWTSLAYQAHSLKGVAGNLGFGQLAAAARHLDQLLKAERHSSCVDSNEEMCRALEQVLALIAKRTPTAPASDAKPEHNRQRLLEQLRHSELIDSSDAATLLQDWQPPLAENTVRAILASIDTLDYDEALRLLAPFLPPGEHA